MRLMEKRGASPFEVAAYYSEYRSGLARFGEFEPALAVAHDGLKKRDPARFSELFDAFGGPGSGRYPAGSGVGKTGKFKVGDKVSHNTRGWKGEVVGPDESSAHGIMVKWNHAKSLPQSHKEEFMSHQVGK